MACVWRSQASPLGSRSLSIETGHRLFEKEHKPECAPPLPNTRWVPTGSPSDTLSVEVDAAFPGIGKREFAERWELFPHRREHVSDALNLLHVLIYRPWSCGMTRFPCVQMYVTVPAASPVTVTSRVGVETA